VNALGVAACAQEAEEPLPGHGLRPPEISVPWSLLAAVVGIVLLVHALRRWRRASRLDDRDR
jgi:hypothetical protein